MGPGFKPLWGLNLLTWKPDPALRVTGQLISKYPVKRQAVKLPVGVLSYTQI